MKYAISIVGYNLSRIPNSQKKEAKILRKGKYEHFVKSILINL